MRILIILLFSFNALALTPLDGLIYGDVKDIRQYDPLSGVFSNKTDISKKNFDRGELKKLMEYIATFRLGYGLQNSCRFYDSYKYLSQWDEANAKRSVAAALQYIGIDITTRAIAEYAKKMEVSASEFQKLAFNLTQSNCSKNISVYSIKFIQDNLMNFYNKESNYKLPSIKKSPFFSENIKNLTNSSQSMEKQLELTIKNFRAFCSWGGSTDDYRMLAPYLANPIIMGLVNTMLDQKKVFFDETKKEITITKAKDPVLVSCRDFICRKTDVVTFKNTFPRMIGSTQVRTDLDSLYCLHFRDQSYKANHPIKTINKWIKEQRLEDPHLETQQFISLMSSIPDLLISSEKYSDVIDSLKLAVEQRFDNWAKEKTDNFVTDLLYEEALQIDLVPLSKTSDIKKGEFKLLFDYSLGELDRVISEVDKIHSTFDLRLPKSYLRWIRDSIIIANNRGRYTEVANLYTQFEAYISTQLEKSKDLFLIPMWNDKMSSIIAKELVAQITAYRGKKLEEFSNEKVRIPIKFRYGLFALKYLRDKFKEKYR